jgi:hypothetical protein
MQLVERQGCLGGFSPRVWSLVGSEDFALRSGPSVSLDELDGLNPGGQFGVNGVGDSLNIRS